MYGGLGTCCGRDYNVQEDYDSFGGTPSRVCPVQVRGLTGILDLQWHPLAMKHVCTFSESRV